MIDNITISVTTYKPHRALPGSIESHVDGWLKSVCKLDICNQIFILEMLNEGETSSDFIVDDKRAEIIPWLNDPPYADPTRQPVLNRAANDWVLFIEDDERCSHGMIQFVNSLQDNDPCPSREWVALSFPREDYIYHEDNWRYVPANGEDHQIRLVNRNHVKWRSAPHTIPEIDGTMLSVFDSKKGILHYRDYNKIISWTKHCNEMFADMPHIVEMQNAYIQRVNQWLGVE